MLTPIKKNTIRRMKIIQGQVKSLLKMIEDEKYCPDVLTQSLAIQNALKQVDAKLLESHLQTCVKKQMKGRETNKAVKELIEIYKLSKKN